MIAKTIARAKACSPYLEESLQLFPELIAQIKSVPPEEILRHLFEDIDREISDLSTEMEILRQLKRRAHLVIAVSDIGKVWGWVEVTEHLTRLADFCLQRILRASATELGISGPPENPAPGLFILAVGKYGSRELNYSSDIDFNVFYDLEKIQMPNPARAERTLIKLVQNVVKGMEAITEHGYIFRTDLRLRPDPRSNSVAVSTRTAERYYETLGQNWERAAMIKARSCAGDIKAGQAFIDQVLSPFIWRKNMDYAAIEDILAIKRQVHAKVGAGEALEIGGHNLKLGFGGIREIEFYAQVQQLILGGRHNRLQTPRTVDALQALADLDFVTNADAQLMIKAYDRLRTAEHALQMIKDEQTHKIPVDETGQTQLSGLLGADKFADVSAEFLTIFNDVRATYTRLFPEAGSLSSREGNMVFTGVEPDPNTLEAFLKLGFKNGETIWYEMAAWLGGRIRATRDEKARELLTILAPKIIENCADTGRPDKAFESFRRFFTAVSGGISLLSRFRQKPDHLKYVIDLITRSELIANWVSDQPAILDALSDPKFLNFENEDFSIVHQNIAASQDFEMALNVSRREVRESKFRISSALLSGKISEELSGTLFSTLAEKTLAALLPIAQLEAERRYGKITGDMAVLGLGKLASGQLNMSSDLDIMLVFNPSDREENVQTKYTRVTQRLISALSAVTEEGPLYEVDMALRPSGRSGPVAVSLTAFETYYQEKAWSWEFMALSRSRIVAASSEKFKQELETLRKTLLSYPRADLNMDEDIADMLRRVRQEKPPMHDLDLKNTIGGIRDIEFVAQKLFLSHRQKLRTSGVNIEKIFDKFSDEIGPAKASVLKQNYTHFLGITQHMAVRIENKKHAISDWDKLEIATALGFQGSSDFMSDLNSRLANVSKIVDEFIF